MKFDFWTYIIFSEIQYPCSNLKYFQVCDFSGFFLISGFFTNLPLPRNFLERREVATKERKWPVLCPDLVSCLWGCGESVNLPKLNIQQVQGTLSSRQKGHPGPLPIFQDLCTFVKSYPWSLYVKANVFNIL